MRPDFNKMARDLWLEKLDMPWYTDGVIENIAKSLEESYNQGLYLAARSLLATNEVEEAIKKEFRNKLAFGHDEG